MNLLKGILLGGLIGVGAGAVAGSHYQNHLDKKTIALRTNMEENIKYLRETLPKDVFDATSKSIKTGGVLEPIYWQDAAEAVRGTLGRLAGKATDAVKESKILKI